MKAIHFYAIVIFILLFSNIYAQPNFKYGTSYKEITKNTASCEFIRLSNGKVFYSTLTKSGVVLKVFDSDNKFIKETKIKGSFKGKRIWWNTDNPDQEFHEIGNKAVLFILHFPRNIPTVETISFDITTNELIERKTIAKYSKYKYGEASNNVRCITDTRFTSMNIQKDLCYLFTIPIKKVTWKKLVLPYLTQISIT